jgi:DNA (cytosine-5)-methyltransferase 1
MDQMDVIGLQLNEEDLAPAPAPALTKLKCVDLFSGIGGISIALSPFAEVIQYCEWDRYCQSVLIQRMHEGRLDRAPIHSDIRNLHISPACQPDIICGGFPCQDISTIGLGKGITEGKKSSMFYEMMRLIDECPSIDVIFLENVSNILNNGITEVLAALDERGWIAQWTVRTAHGQGAPHCRSRWFLLGCRDAAAAQKVAFTARVAAAGPDVVRGENVWRGTEPAVRCSIRPEAAYADEAAAAAGKASEAANTYDDHWPSRCHTLGNTVVPCVVRTAFMDLASGCARWHDYVQITADSGIPLEVAVAGNGSVPDSAIFYKGKVHVIPKRYMEPPEPHNVDITTPGSITKFNGEYVKYQNFPTPRRAMTHAATINDRSVRDLPTILVYCKTTADYLAQNSIRFHPDKALHNVLVINVNYIEWMMGYPKDWTRISFDADSVPIPMPPARATVARQRRLKEEGEGEAGASGTSDVIDDAIEVVGGNDEEAL